MPRPKGSKNGDHKQYTKKGNYIAMYVPSHPRSHGGYVYEHLIIAEETLGKPLPEGAEVHHANGNKQDNRKGNLVICPNHKYHTLLHYRKRIIDAGGNFNIHKVCGTCKTLKEKSEFNKDATNPPDGRRGNCKSCEKERTIRTKEYQQARAKKYQEANRDEINRKSLERYWANRDEINRKRRKSFIVPQN